MLNRLSLSLTARDSARLGYSLAMRRPPDLASNKMFKVQTTDEVLARLGGKG